MKHAYLYYRITPGATRETALRADALLAELSPFCAVAPRRLVRCDDTLTWMEIYEGVADWNAFVAAMEGSLQALPFAPPLDGERHLECFVVPAAEEEGDAGFPG